MTIPQGTIFVADASGNLAPLPLGPTGHVLTSTGTTLGYTAPPSGGGGSSGLTHAYIGSNVVGASWETMPTNQVYATRVVLDAAGLLGSVGVYVKNPASANDDRVHSLAAAVYADNGGNPTLLIASTTNPQNSVLFDNAVGADGDDVGRWYHMPLGLWLEAGAYWVAVQQHRNTAYMQIAHGAGGTDRTHAATGSWFADWGFHTPTTTGNRYSIRASVVK